jgi:hypothetical protein
MLDGQSTLQQGQDTILEAVSSLQRGQDKLLDDQSKG